MKPDENPSLRKLKASLHPCGDINVLEQCRIVAEALHDRTQFKNGKALAKWLEVSGNQVYKMQRINRDLTREAREFFSQTDYQVNTTYSVASLSPEEQSRWVAEAKAAFQLLESEGKMKPTSG